MHSTTFSCLHWPEHPAIVYFQLVFYELIFFSLLPQVAGGVLVQEEEWEISSVEEVRAATVLLPHKQPSDELRVVLDRSRPTELKPLLAAVKAAGYEGKLCLTLLHYYRCKIPCDEQMQQLKGAK